MSDGRRLTPRQTVELLRALRQARLERLRREDEFQKALRHATRSNRLRHLFTTD